MHTLNTILLCYYPRLIFPGYFGVIGHVRCLLVLPHPWHRNRHWRSEYCNINHIHYKRVITRNLYAIFFLLHSCNYTTAFPKFFLCRRWTLGIKIKYNVILFISISNIPYNIVYYYLFFHIIFRRLQILFLWSSKKCVTFKLKYMNGM